MKFAAFAFVVCVSVAAVSAVVIDHEEIEYRSGFFDSPKCVMKTVFNITNVVKQCISDLKACSKIPNEREQKMINSLDKIVEAADEIIYIYDGDCEGGERMGVDCTSKMTNPIINLVGNVVKNAKAMTEFVKSPAAVSACSWKATLGMDEYLWTLPGNIKNCLW